MYFVGIGKTDNAAVKSVTINTAFESFLLNGMSWITTQPTESGWYWIIYEGERRVAWIDANVVYDAVVTHYLGPIPPPEMPEK